MEDIPTAASILFGKLTRTDPEHRRLVAIGARRRAADIVTTVCRSRARPTDPNADDAADEEEIEIGVQGEMTRAEEDTGYPGGFAYYGAVRIDNGEEIELTADEIEQITIDAVDAEADRAEDYDKGAYGREGDR